MNRLMSVMVFPCEKIREFVYDFVDGALDPLTSMRFRLHVKTCDCCHEYVKLYAQAADPVAFRAANPPPPEFLDRTLDFLRNEGLIDSDGASGSKTDADPPYFICSRITRTRFIIRRKSTSKSNTPANSSSRL